jgi:hypothetical protein
VFTSKNKYVIMILLVGAVIIAMSTINGAMIAYSQTAAQNSSSLSSSAIGANNTSVKLRGGIGSLQDHQKDNPLWIVQGHWEMSLTKPLQYIVNGNNTAKTFNASFTMISLNGSLKDKDSISDFKQTNSSIKNDSSQITLNGTATIISKKLGRFEQVPVSLKIIRNNAFSVWIDPRNVNNYFGKTPIYGTIYQTPQG